MFQTIPLGIGIRAFFFTDPNGIEEFHVRIRDDAGRRFDWVVPSSGNIEEE